MVLTGLTKIKLKDVFVDMENVTIGTSSGLIYSWGANLTAVNQDEGDDRVSRQWGCLDFSIDWEAVRNIAGATKFCIIVHSVPFNSLCSPNYDEIYVPNKWYMPFTKVRFLFITCDVIFKLPLCWSNKILQIPWNWLELLRYAKSSLFS